MAELTEKTEWVDGIYQLETSDPVMGGPGGISNRQANQLANRTVYLKQQQEQTGSTISQHVAAANPHKQYAPINSPALTGTPTAPTPAQATNNTQIATTEFVRSAIGDFSAESFKNRLAVNGYQMLPSGLILQWGTLSMTSTSANTYTILPFLFPITFPTALCSISGSIRTGLAGDAYTSFSFEKATNAGATLYYTTAGTDMFPTINWMAVGY